MPKAIDAQIRGNIFNEWKIGIDNKDYDFQTAEDYKESEVSIPMESLRKLVVVFSDLG